MYKALNPRAKDVVEADIKTITLTTILSNGLYNDLGLLVKNKIIFLIEAQSTWSINIILRMFVYLADTYKKIVKDNKGNLYGTKKIEIPIPELYVLYLGNDKIKKKEYSLNEEYFEGKGPIDLKVKIITVRSQKDILSEYIEFAHRCDDLRKSKRDIVEKDVVTFINKCIKDDILKEFLENHKEEVMSIETMLFDQDYVTEMYEHELIEQGRIEGKVEGKSEGIEIGTINTLNNLVKDGLLTKEEARKLLKKYNKTFMKL